MFNWLKKISSKTTKANGEKDLGEVDYFKLQPVIKELLEAHGVETSIYKEWVLNKEDLPGIRGFFHNVSKVDSGYCVRLDIDVGANTEQTIFECFAGVGDNEKNTKKDAIEDFCNCTLYVMLAAFWGIIDRDRVRIETWRLNETDWKVYIGNYVRRSKNDEDIPVLEVASSKTEELIKSLTLEDDLYWVRSFYCNAKDENKTSEALLNNESWKNLQNVLSDLDWPATDEYYSARNFIILKKEV